jgi:hypothetical protein
MLARTYEKMFYNICNEQIGHNTAKDGKDTILLYRKRGTASQYRGYEPVCDK